jgi:hypothetical protein
MTDTIAARTSVAPNYNLSVFDDPPTSVDEVRKQVDALPLEEIDVANPKLFHNDVIAPYFERLRREDPVHYAVNKIYGGYWSITKYNDIMAIDTNHKQFSSEAGLGGITIFGDAYFPGTIETHCQIQEFYFGEDFLLRRHDYRVNIAGGFQAAQLTGDYVEANGIKLPTRRRAYTRGPDGRPIQEMLMVHIDLTDVTFT